jgi:DNA polymerase III delta prime subunit
MNASHGGQERAQSYLIAGGAESIDFVYSFLKERGVDVHANPDVYVREYKQFTIDDAREIRTRAQTRALGEHGRAFIVVSPVFTIEAQNALLKTLEEPAANAMFFIVTQSPQTLLPTLQSRTQTIAFNKSDDERRDQKTVIEFLKTAPAQRLELMKELYEHDEDDERDLRKAISFLQALEEELGRRPTDAGTTRSLRSIYRARKYMTDKGALLKPLLEQVALFAPSL